MEALEKLFAGITDDQIKDMVLKARTKVHEKEVVKVELTRQRTIAEMRAKKEST